MRNSYNEKYSLWLKLTILPFSPYSPPHTIDINTDIHIGVTYDECYNGEAVVNSMVMFECFAPDGVPMPNVSWYKGDVKLRQSNLTNIEFSRNKRIMTIRSFAITDVGEYHCQAVNSFVTNGTRESRPKSVNLGKLRW